MSTSPKYYDQTLGEWVHLTTGPRGGGSGSGSVTDPDAVHKTGDESIDGVKAFTSSPIIPVATLSNQAVNKLQLDNKLDKTNVADRVYISNYLGVPDVGVFSTNADAFTFAFRDEFGTIAVGTPTAAGHAANKTYVDTKANDNAVIHTTGNESATGTKVFENGRFEAPSGDVLTVTGTGTNNTILRFKDDGAERGAIFSLNSSSDFVVRSQADVLITTTQGGTPKSTRFGSAGITLADGYDLSFNTTTGTKIGTSTGQKIGFFNSTPIAKPSGNVLSALANLGLVASGTISQADVTNLTTDLANKIDENLAIAYAVAL